MTADQKGSSQSFWGSLPGILTGLAAVITAIVALYGTLGSKPGDRRQEDADQRPVATVPKTPNEQTPKRGGAEPPSRAPESRPEPSRGFRVVETMLRADPFNYEGPCPVIVRFSGRISVAGGSGAVSYKFLRSDGASAPVTTLAFSAPSSADVSTTWRLTASHSGWQQIQILDPAESLSNRAEFTLRCR